MSETSKGGSAKNAKVPHGKSAAAKSASAGPSIAPAGEGAAYSVIFGIEEKIRAAMNEQQLVHLIANETRKLVAARQIFVLRARAEAEFRVECVSSLALADRDTPLIRWIEAIVASFIRERGASASLEFALPAYSDPESSETRTYPFPHFYYQPITLPAGHPFAALLLTRERPWSEAEAKLLARQASVYASAWQAQYGERHLKPRPARPHWQRPALAVAALALAVLPVPLTTLAPVEIVPRNPHRVTAPIDGVIAEVVAEPNKPVRKGQVLFRFDDTSLKSKLSLSEREMMVANSRFERAQQAAFTEEAARHELAIARTELELKKAERDYAALLFAQSVVKAERDGVLVYADKDQWLGRPVKTGERIMQIADPSDVAANIELPVGDAIVLERGAAVRLFMDFDPLSSVSAKLVSSSYHAEPNSAQQLIYRLRAELVTKTGGMRIGARGAAQLYGAHVPLAFFLLRRPIAAARQYFGI